MVEEKPCGEHRARLKNLEDEKSEVWQAIEKIREGIDLLRNRPPVWTSLLIAALTGALGWVLHYAIAAARLAAIGK